MHVHKILTERRSGRHHQQSNIVVVVMVVVYSNHGVVVVESGSCQNVAVVAMEPAICTIQQRQLHQLSFFEFVFTLRLQIATRRHS